MIQNSVYFITTDYILKYYSGYLDPNIDANSLNSFILIAQNIRTQSILGYDLYTKYINDINTYGSPTGSQYVYLMDNYIQPEVALWTIYEALPVLDTRITNKGIVNKTSDYSHTADLKRMDRLLNQISNNSQFFDTRIREYITNFPSQFPEYFTITGVNRVRAKQDPYFAGLWLPDQITTRRKGGSFERGPGCCNGGGYYLY